MLRPNSIDIIESRERETIGNLIGKIENEIQ